MSSIETPPPSSPEVFQSLIYEGNYYPAKSDVLLLRSHSGLLTLPESEADPRIDESGFVSDIRESTGLTVGPYVDTFEKSLSKYWPEGIEAHKIVLPHEKATHFILSRIVEGDLSVDSRFSGAEWVNIMGLPDDQEIDPFSLLNLKRVQVTWALANTF